MGEYFGTYGEIENINLKMDPMTGRSRGFAFIVFKDLPGIEAALKQTAHVVKGKKVTCKKAEARQGKIYVGKLPAGEALSKGDLQAHFEQFGSVVEVVRPVDKMKNNEPKTFAFITFAREDAAKQLVKQGQSTINDTHTVEIKKVTPKEQMGGGGWGGQGYEAREGAGVTMTPMAMEAMAEDMETRTEAMEVTEVDGELATEVELVARCVAVPGVHQGAAAGV